MKTNCAFCNNEINKRPSQIAKYKNSFCNKDCQYNFFNKKVKTICETCGKEILKRQKDINKSKFGKFFCSKSCSATWLNQQPHRVGKNHPNWKDGSSSYRSFCFKNKENHECERCGWKIYPHILHVHHKDKDRTNGSLDNLELLCPNCHCLEHYGEENNLFFI